MRASRIAAVAVVLFGLGFAGDVGARDKDDDGDERYENGRGPRHSHGWPPVIGAMMLPRSDGGYETMPAPPMSNIKGCEAR